ncbi:MAG: hypothetical protein GY854_33965 [Deltaproteobacteria bacterium]|nr:hypothetical protein [Deltaproteobacteria bacterium]
MLEIIIEPRRAFNLRQVVTEAISSGDYDSLNDDIRDCFDDEQIDQIEELLESGDISEAIDDVVVEWNAEDVEDLFEALETYFADSSIELQFDHSDEFDDEEDKDFDLYDDEPEEPSEQESGSFENEEDT